MAIYDPREIPQFVILGIAVSDIGRVALVASKKLTEYDIEHKRDEPEYYWELLGPITRSHWVITLRVRMTEYVVITASTYPEAFTSLFEHWSPEPDAPARAELPAPKRWDDPTFTESDLRAQFAEYGITLPAPAWHSGPSPTPAELYPGAATAYAEWLSSEDPPELPELPAGARPLTEQDVSDAIEAARNRRWPPELPAPAHHHTALPPQPKREPPELAAPFVAGPQGINAPAESDSAALTGSPRGDGTGQDEDSAADELDWTSWDEPPPRELDWDSHDWRPLGPGVFYAADTAPEPRELPPGG